MDLDRRPGPASGCRDVSAGNRPGYESLPERRVGTGRDHFSFNKSDDAGGYDPGHHHTRREHLGCAQYARCNVEHNHPQRTATVKGP